MDIKLRTAVSKTFQPFIILELKGQKSILTPAEAVQHALSIIENADISIVNAFLAEYMTINLNLQPDHVKGVLNDFRQFRERKKREKIDDDSSIDIIDGAKFPGTN